MRYTYVFRVEFFQEDDVYVGLCPQLNVSSLGETLPQAKASLREAIEAFIEECETLGTLEAVLEEARLRGKGERFIRNRVSLRNSVSSPTHLGKPR